MTIKPISTQEYDDFRRYLEDASGIVLGGGRQQFISSRLRRLMHEFAIEDYAQLVAQLRAQRSSRLHEQLMDAITHSETLWFRDGYPFEVLKHQILPELTSAKASPLRIWSAACSSGQEAYSISMTIEEYLGSRPGAVATDIQIIGSDISAAMLREAREGSYDSDALSLGISEERRERFFTAQGDMWQLRPEVSGRTSFQEFNLLHDFSALGKFDIIFCRNVLLYFASELKTDILNRMAESLNPGGYLFLGGAESPGSYTDAFETLHTPCGVAYRPRG